MTGVHFISVYIFNRVWNLQSFSIWDSGIYINPEHKTSYSTLYDNVFETYEVNEFFADCGYLLIINTERIRSYNHFHFIQVSRSDQSCYDVHDWPSDNEEYLIPENVAETTPG